MLTTVCYAMTLARTAPARTPARIRIPTNAVWATVIFALNIFAFIFIGLQIRPILADLQPPAREQYLLVAAAVLATVIVVRIAWHMSFNAVIRWRDRRFGFHPPRPMLRPTVGSGLVISWAGMRGIVTLAAALALPAGFPARDVIVLTAFSGRARTLLIQGLTLKTLLRALDLHDGDPVARRSACRPRARAGGRLTQLPPASPPAVDLVRKDLQDSTWATPSATRVSTGPSVPATTLPTARPCSPRAGCCSPSGTAAKSATPAQALRLGKSHQGNCLRKLSTCPDGPASYPGNAATCACHASLRRTSSKACTGGSSSAAFRQTR